MLHSTGQRMFLLLILLHLSESDLTTNVEGTAGKDLKIEFKFISNSSIKTECRLTVYKNKTKIRSFPNLSNSCPPSSPVQKQQIDFCILNASSSNITLLFINPDVVDSGVYFLAVFFEHQIEAVIESKSVNLTVGPVQVTTAPELTSSNNNNTSSPHIDSSGTISQWIILSVLVASLVLVLVGLLVWFCQTYRTKSDVDAPAPNPSITQQGSCPKLNTVPVVSCVEYGVLDFQNRPIRPERRSRDVEASEASVEYAAIMFPPQKKK